MGETDLIEYLDKPDSPPPDDDENNIPLAPETPLVDEKDVPQVDDAEEFVPPPDEDILPLPEVEEEDMSEPVTPIADDDILSLEDVKESTPETTSLAEPPVAESPLPDEDVLPLDEAEEEDISEPVTPIADDDILSLEDIEENPSETTLSEPSVTEPTLPDEDILTLDEAEGEDISEPVTPIAEDDIPPLEEAEESPPETTLSESTATELPLQDEDVLPSDETEEEEISEPVTPIAEDDILPLEDVEESKPETTLSEPPVTEPPLQDEDILPLDEAEEEDISESITPIADDDILSLEDIEESTPETTLSEPTAAELPLSDEDVLPSDEIEEEEKSEPVTPIADDDIFSFDDIEESSPPVELPEPPAEEAAAAAAQPEATDAAEELKESPGETPQKKKFHIAPGVFKIAAAFAALLIVSMSISAFVAYKAGSSRAKTRNVAARGSSEIFGENEYLQEYVQDEAPIPPDENELQSQELNEAAEDSAVLLPQAESVPETEIEAPELPPQRRLSASVPIIPPDSELTRARIIGDNVNIRKSPDMESVVLFQISASSSEFFIVEKSDITDSGDESDWYKIVFSVDDAFGDYYYERWPLYISGRFTETYPLEMFDRFSLDWFRQGRPPFIYRGDDLSLSRAVDLSVVTRYELTEQITLKEYPDENSDNIPAERGTAILIPFENTAYLPGKYLDVNDEFWMPVIDSDKEMLGWMELEAYKNIPVNK